MPAARSYHPRAAPPLRDRRRRRGGHRRRARRARSLRRPVYRRLMAEPMQRPALVGADAALHHQVRRDPLIVDARCGHGCLGVLPEGQDVEQHLQRSRGDERAAGSTRDGDHLAATRDDRGRHAAQRALARRDRIGFRADQAEDIRRARLRREVVHRVIEDDPRVAGDEHRTEGRVDTGRARDRVPHPIDDRYMRGAGVVGERVIAVVGR